MPRTTPHVNQRRARARLRREHWLWSVFICVVPGVLRIAHAYVVHGCTLI